MRKNFLVGLFYLWQNYAETQHHALSVTPKNWEFGECTEPRNLSVFNAKLQKPERFFPGGEHGELSIKKRE